MLRMRGNEKTYALTDEEIDALSESVGETLEKSGVEWLNRIRVRLTLEESLLRLQGHFGSDATIAVSKVRNLFGSRIVVVHEGEPFNPLNADTIKLGEWRSSFFTYVGVQPQYAYSNGRNIIRLPLPQHRINPVLLLVAAIVLGMGVGFAMDAILPKGIQSLVATVGSPLFNLWVQTLNALAAPVIFFTATTTLLNMRRVEEQGGSQGEVTSRYFIYSFALGALAVACAAMVYRLGARAGWITDEQAGGLVSGITQIIPKNLVDPFVTSNTHQLLLLAFVVGSALITLGDRAKEVVSLVQQVNLMNAVITQRISTLVPVVTAILAALEILNGQRSIIAQLWRPLLLGFVVASAWFLFELVMTSRQYDVSLRALVRKLRAPFVTALRTGSLDDSYEDTERSCVEGLGIEKSLVEVALPQGLVLYMPASIMGTLVFTVFAARENGLETTVAWYVMAIVLDVLLFVATPPVPGANLLAFITLFNVLGIPDDVFLDAMIFDILYGVYANAANQTLLQLEMLRQSGRMGLLNRKVLRSE